MTDPAAAVAGDDGRRSAADLPGEVPVLALEGVSIGYQTRAGLVPVVDRLDLKLYRGQAFGLVGESGCGKSTVAFSVMRYLGAAGRVTAGRMMFEGRDLNALSDAELRGIRGARIAMVYQDPMSSLNPVMTVGRQLMEVPLLHGETSRARARDRALAMLEEVRMPDPVAAFERYPHQLSGGQQQRVVIAMALMAEPALLVMDEPTTGLDVTVEAAVLDLVAELRERHNSALLFISHNLGTVARTCDRIGVMYLGDMVEEGPIDAVFANPRHPYTAGLLDSIPLIGLDKRAAQLKPIPGSISGARVRPPGCVFQERCRHMAAGRCDQGPVMPTPVGEEAVGHRVRCVRVADLAPWRRGLAAVDDLETGADTGEEILKVSGLRKTYVSDGSIFGGRASQVRALAGVDLTARKGTTLAIVGESGCGKSTFAKVLTGLEVASHGEVEFAGVDVSDIRIEKRDRELRRRLQMVFQNPDSTLNPSHSVGYAIKRALKRLRGMSSSEADKEMRRLLKVVELPEDFAGRLPRQLSGGQKQRVAIARALAGSPDVVVADEPVSALDVSVQATIINLLIELQAANQTTMVFISHDLSVVRYLADQVAVMYHGHVVELGDVDAVFSPPYHPYTEALLSAVPVPDPGAEQTRIPLDGAMPQGSEAIRGCPFAARCPRSLGSLCETKPPPEQVSDGGHRILCHIPLDDLAKVPPIIALSTAAE